MRLILRSLASFTFLTAIIMIVTNPCLGGITPGQEAPAFSLMDASGKTYDLSTLKDRPMLIVYFFDAESRPSQEGLLSLDNLAKRYRDANLVVWGVTLSPRDNVESFLSGTSLGFPVLLDKSGVSNLYNARLVLPTVCVLGPGPVIVDYFQGGGKTTEIMLVRLAQRQLQRREIMMAKAISDEVVKINPQNAEALAVKGYAALKEGDLDEAEKTFSDLAVKQGKNNALGNEGLTAVYAMEGKSEKALEFAAKVESQAPDRSYVNVVKGDILYSQGKNEEAATEYRKAVGKHGGEPFQKAVAHNRLGRFHASLGKYDKARELYDQALVIDPYYIEATSNKGMSYEKEGRWSDALKAYTDVLNLSKNDTFSAVLAKKAREMLSLQQDVSRKKRMDNLVKELAARYKSQKKSRPKTKDTWTSRPMVLTFVDFQEKGGLTNRDGFSIVLTTHLGDQLNASGRVQVVERVLVERLLEELNLGSSELADKETALRLGNVLAAKIVGTGSLFFMPDTTLLSMRLIDTETSAIPKVVTRQYKSQTALEKELNKLNREILKSIIEKYPLQGYVVQQTGDEVMLNIGSKQGVVLGTKFEVIEEQEPVKYKGKLLRGSPKSIGQVEVIRVEQDLSYAHILTQEKPIKTDDKVKEKLVDLVAMGESSDGQ